MIKAIIFDLDGTLLYTLEDLKNSTNFALKHFNYPERTLDEIRNFVGNGVAKLIELAIPDGKNNTNFEDCLDLMKEHYSNNNSLKTKPYPEVLKLLKILKQKCIKIGIVSNKYDLAVKELCKIYFDGFYDIALGESENCSKKPAPDGVFSVIKDFGIEKDEVLYVGDSQVDIQTAKNAGIECVSVLWGYKSKNFLIKYGAKTVISNPLELLDKLESNC